MATRTIRNPAVAPVNENRGESKVRSVYNAIAHTLKPLFLPIGLESLNPEHRAKLTATDRGILDAYYSGAGPN